MDFSPELPPIGCVEIPILDDDLLELNESFLVQLLPIDDNVTVVDGTLSETKVFITDNDGRVTIRD